MPKPMRTAFSLLFTITLAFCASLASAADYYVSPQGNDDNDGTSASAPWRTIAKANRSVRPGDVVHLLGGKYVNDPIRPEQSGTPEAPIRYRAYGDGEPVLTSDEPRGLEIAIDLRNRSHIRIEGIHVDGVEGHPKARVQHFVEIEKGSYNTIAGSSFRYAYGWHGIRIGEGSHNNKLVNNVIDFVGVFRDENGQDYGDSIQINGGATSNLLQGNVVTRGAHNLLQVKGDRNVIRRNVFDNDWSAVAGKGAGGRNLSLMGRSNLFEENIVRNAGRSADVPSNAGMKTEGERNIVRRNLIYANSKEGITSESRSGSKIARDNRIYHNTFYGNGGPAWGLVFYEGGEGVTGNVFKNNIVYGNRRDPSITEGDLLFRLESNPSGEVGQSIIEGNLIAKSSGNDATIELRGVGAALDLAEAEKRFDAHFRGNIEAEPIFASPDPQEPQDFALQPGSPGIDAAVPLTYTRAGGSGKVVPIEDPAYFTDGFGVTLGDVIRIGKSRPTRVMKVDYEASTLTLADPVQWSQGEPVTLDYRGSGPDIGAVESGLEFRRPKSPGGVTAWIR
ncbi:MAG: right-handed parallel beta-helix repeat-containing protein [Gammaproteobacteria bacterium]|nr:hypothetical protein [Gammaproteobacteria bacterium]